MYHGAASFSHTAVTLANSTVSRNIAYSYVAGIYSGQAMTLLSSIVADNRGITGPANDICSPSIAGAANLIMASCSSKPADTIETCPRLTALGDHGGSTTTHALVAGGPGIDVGNNTVLLDADQRGVSYPRVDGVRADIGAYEWQGDFGDEMFKSAFETACDRY